MRGEEETGEELEERGADRRREGTEAAGWDVRAPGAGGEDVEDNSHGGREETAGQGCDRGAPRAVGGAMHG